MLQSGHGNETRTSGLGSSREQPYGEKHWRLHDHSLLSTGPHLREIIHDKRHLVTGKNLGENNRKTPPPENRIWNQRKMCQKIKRQDSTRGFEGCCLQKVFVTFVSVQHLWFLMCGGTMCLGAGLCEWMSVCVPCTCEHTWLMSEIFLSHPPPFHWVGPCN